jgi:hypothetical protein
MWKENDHVPPPWGDDMEEALMAQGEAIPKKTISVPRRRWLSWCRSTTLRGLGLIIAIILVWFLLAFAMALARGSAQSYPKRLGSIFQTRQYRLLRVEPPQPGNTKITA